MIFELLKAILVGICAAAPVGPVLINVIQKTLLHGRRAGRLCGVGSALADGAYAAVGLLALGMLQTFIDSYTPQIMIGGGVLVSVMGLNMLVKKYDIDFSRHTCTSYSNDFSFGVQTFCMAISNPTALAVMMMLLAFFGLADEGVAAPKSLIMVAVPFGEVLYWFVVTALLSRFIRLRESTLVLISRVAGGIILGFGIFLIVKGITAL